MTAAIMVLMVGVAPRVMARFGFKPPTAAGLFLLAAGLVWLSFARSGGSFVVDVLGRSLVAAAGMALAFIPSLGTAISSARSEEGGLASGIVNTSYQVGSALGLAAMTALAVAHGSTQLGQPDVLTSGFSAAFLGAAIIAAANRGRASNGASGPRADRCAGNRWLTHPQANGRALRGAPVGWLDSPREEEPDDWMQRALGRSAGEAGRSGVRPVLATDGGQPGALQGSESQLLYT